MRRFISWHFWTVTLSDEETFDIHRAGPYALTWSRPRGGGQIVDSVCYNPKFSVPRDPNRLGAFHVSSAVFDITGFSTVKRVTVERGKLPSTK